MMVPDPEDKHWIEAYLAQLANPMTWDECLRAKPSFIKQHCRFVIPPPEILHDIVVKVWATQGCLNQPAAFQPSNMEGCEEHTRVGQIWFCL